MGYWCAHPLSGDAPLEAINFLMNSFDMEEIYSQWANEEFTRDTKTYIKFVKEFKEALYRGEVDVALEGYFVSRYPFVIPYAIAEFGVKLEDENLVTELKMLIKDGGSKERGYEAKESNKENNYNDFQSPNDFACQLRDNWENIVLHGKVDYQKDISRFIYLDEVIYNAQLDAKKNGTICGLINVK